MPSDIEVISCLFVKFVLYTRTAPLGRGAVLFLGIAQKVNLLRLNAKTRLFCIFLGKDCSKNGSICPAEASKTAPQGQKRLNLPRGGPKDCAPGAKTAQFAPRRPQRLRPRGKNSSICPAEASKTAPQGQRQAWLCVAAVPESTKVW